MADDAACTCCGEPNDQAGDACSFCVAWGCADDPKPHQGEVIDTDPWLAEQGPIGGGA